MGDVQQNINNTTCPNCDATNVRVIKCQSIGCSSRFCEICHPNCRIEGSIKQRFDSGLGLGPFCFDCLNPKIEAAMNAQRWASYEQKKIEGENHAAFSLMVEEKRIRDNAIIAEQIAEQKDRDEILGGLAVFLSIIGCPLTIGGVVYTLYSGFSIVGFEGVIALIAVVIGMLFTLLALVVQSNTSQGLSKE